MTTIDSPNPPLSDISSADLNGVAAEPGAATTTAAAASTTMSSSTRRTPGTFLSSLRARPVY